MFHPRLAIILLAVSAAISLFLLLGCGPLVEVVRLDQSTKASLRREVGVYNGTGLSSAAYQTIQPLKATSCQNKTNEPLPSRDDAVDQLRYKAQALGANGLTNLRCGPIEGVSLVKNCWNSVTCYATAIKVSPEATRVLMTPEDKQEETRRKIATMQEKVNRAVAECRQKRLTGELKSYVESVQCSNPLILEAHEEAADPNMDLMQLYCAYRLALAERNDKGEMTEAEANVAMQELALRVSQEARQRARQQQAGLRQQAIDLQQQNNARMQAYGVLLQGLGTWQSANKIEIPQVPQVQIPQSLKFPASPGPQLNPPPVPQPRLPIVCTPLYIGGVVRSITCQ